MTRRVIEVTGTDRESFLQGLISNDLRRALPDGLIHAALLTPQGKYLADFFLWPEGERLLIDASEAQADGLLRRLSMYRLRADVALGLTDLQVSRGILAPPPDARPDPRHPALGWRRIGPDVLTGALPEAAVDWDALRVEHLIPESGIELTPETYILEAGFERLHGVDFRKGCYVGQEVTARMKHKTELRKGLVRVRLDGEAPPPGTPILMEDGREAGTLYTAALGRALAHLRHDRAAEPLTAGSARVTVDLIPR